MFLNLLSQVQQSTVEPSPFYKLSKRLSKKTPASEALSPVIPFKDAQETLRHATTRHSKVKANRTTT